MLLVRRVIACLALALPAVVAAQSSAPNSGERPGPLQRSMDPPAGVTLSGSVRLRYEALDGQFRPGFDEEDDLVSVRTILSAEYRRGAFRVGGEVYDSRAYDGEPGSAVSANDVNALELVQAYVGADLDSPFGKGSRVSVQAGRFTLNLGSRRLIAADDYRNTTNGFTGLRTDMRGPGGITATLLYVLPQVRLPDDQPSVLRNARRWDRESFDLKLWGGIVSRTHLPARISADMTLLRLEERDSAGRPTRDRRLTTFGGRIIREPGPGRFDFEIEAIGQRGRIATGLAEASPQMEVKASFYHADVGYAFTGAWQPRLSVEYDRASGDGPGPRYGRFDTLYGMRRADLAPAGIYAAIGRTNIDTPAIRLEVSPDRRTDAFAAWRLLRAEEATDVFSTTGVRDPKGSSGRRAGQQIEGRVRHWVVPGLLRFEANAAWLAKRGILREAPNAPRTGDTLYVSVAATTSF